MEAAEGDAQLHPDQNTTAEDSQSAAKGQLSRDNMWILSTGNDFSIEKPDHEVDLKEDILNDLGLHFEPELVIGLAIHREVVAW